MGGRSFQARNGRPPEGSYTKRTAEAELRRILTAAERGELPAQAKRSGATVADAVEEWLRYCEQERIPDFPANAKVVAERLVRRSPQKSTALQRCVPTVFQSDRWIFTLRRLLRLARTRTPADQCPWRRRS
jgi:hypothetical protein